MQGGAADEGLAVGDEAGAFHPLHLHPAAAAAAEPERLNAHASGGGGGGGGLARPEVASDDGLPVAVDPRGGGERYLPRGVGAPPWDAPPPGSARQECAAGHFGRAATWVYFQKYLLGFCFDLVMLLWLGATFTHAGARRPSDMQPSWNDIFIATHFIETPHRPLLNSLLLLPPTFSLTHTGTRRLLDIQPPCNGIFIAIHF